MHDSTPIKARKRLPGGGRKKGSGKYLEPTTIARVPQSIAASIDFYYHLPEMLEHLAILWETRYRGSVRGEVAKSFAADLRELMSVRKRSTL